MDINRDYEELFKILNTFKIKYLVVGAYAVIYYTKPRYTKDLDIWIPPQLNDKQNVFTALKKFGSPLKGMIPDDFQDKTMIYQLGVAPIRIDIMMDVPGVSVQEAWRNRKKTRYGKTSIYILDIEDLKKAKSKANRPEDKLDLKNLSKKNWEK